MKKTALFPMAAALSMVATATAGPALKQIAYESVLEDGQIEVRRYDSMQVVTGPMDTDESRKVEKAEGTRGDSSFKTLLGYLGGENAAGKKFPMRAPIFVDASKPDALTMSFVLAEKGGALSGEAPAPAAGALRTRSLAGGHFAALRYKGYRSRDAELEAINALRAWLAQRGLKAEGGALLAYYDPPWTPKPMQRNEVLMRLSASAVKALAKK